MTRTCKRLPNSPVIRLTRPPLTKFSNVENPIKSSVFSRIYLIFSKISSLDAPAFARRAASTTWNFCAWSVKSLSMTVTLRPESIPPWRAASTVPDNASVK